MGFWVMLAMGRNGWVRKKSPLHLFQQYTPITLTASKSRSKQVNYLSNISVLLIKDNNFLCFDSLKLQTLVQLVSKQLKGKLSIYS